MKVSIDIPDKLLHRLERAAAMRNIPQEQLVYEVLTDRLMSIPLDEADFEQRQEARMKWAGKLRHLRKETARINAVIEKEFERD